MPQSQPEFDAICLLWSAALDRFHFAATGLRDGEVWCQCVIEFNTHKGPPGCGLVAAGRRDGSNSGAMQPSTQNLFQAQHYASPDGEPRRRNLEKS
jgi:hypothetical protein